MVSGITVVLAVYISQFMPDCGAFKRYAVLAVSLIGTYKAADISLMNMVIKRQACDPQSPTRRLQAD